MNSLVIDVTCNVLFKMAAGRYDLESSIKKDHTNASGFFSRITQHVISAVFRFLVRIVLINVVMWCNGISVLSQDVEILKRKSY